jgi:hypothetical protein
MVLLSGPAAVEIETLVGIPAIERFIPGTPFAPEAVARGTL